MTLIWSQVLVLLAASLVSSEVPQQPPRNRPRQETTNTQRGTDSAPVVVKLLPAPNQQAVASEQARESAREAGTDRWIVRFTAALVGTGLVQMALFWWQLSLINRSLKDSKQAAEAATIGAAAAKEAADATKETVKVMRENAASQARISALGLRAYATVQWEGDGFNRWEKPEGWYFQWRATIINKGSTPALKVRAIGKSFVFQDPFPGTVDRDALTMELIEETRPVNWTTLVSGQTTACLATCGPLTAEEASAASLGVTAKFYVLWTVLYEDVFEGSRQTLNAFTERWDAAGIGRVHSADFHNKAD